MSAGAAKALQFMKILDFRTDVLPFMIATLGEWGALFYWLRWTLDDAHLVANVVLWAGFLVERGAVLLWLRFVHRPTEGVIPASTAGATFPGGLSGPPAVLALLLVITLPEILIWVTWLWLWTEVGIGVAIGALAVLMLLEHSWELALVKRSAFKGFLSHPPTLFFTAMEVVAPAIWLHLTLTGRPFLGGLVLLFGLSIEHVIEGATLKESRSPATAGSPGLAG